MLLLERLAQLQAELRALLMAPQYSLPFLQPGRLIRVLPEPRFPGHELPSFAEWTDEDVAAAGAAFGDKQAG
jgi:ATP-dependent RNA helicase DOB1